METPPLLYVMITNDEGPYPKMQSTPTASVFGGFVVTVVGGWMADAADGHYKQGGGGVIFQCFCQLLPLHFPPHSLPNQVRWGWSYFPMLLPTTAPSLPTSFPTQPSNT